MSNFDKLPVDQPPQEKVTGGGEYTKASLIAYLQDELIDLRNEWDQNFEIPPVGRPEDWQDQLAFIEEAVAELKAGNDPSRARAILDSEIYLAQRALNGAALYKFPEGYVRDNARKLRKKHLEKLEAFRLVIAN